MKKVSLQVKNYRSLNHIEIHRSDNPQDEYEFQMYIFSGHIADTLMTREDLSKLRDSIDDMLNK